MDLMGGRRGAVGGSLVLALHCSLARMASPDLPKPSLSLAGPILTHANQQIFTRATNT